MAGSIPAAIKGNGALAILHTAWGLLKIVLIPCLIGLLLLQLLTPSLRYSQKSARVFYNDFIPPKDISLTSGSGRSWNGLRTTLLTHDYRNLQVDYLLPASGYGTAAIPITIIVSPFLPPEWLIDRVRPRGYNAIVVYRSPRMERIQGGFWPSARQFGEARNLGDYWDILATNPINRLYNVYAALHEAPSDVVDIAIWAEKNIKGDPTRINIIGLGSGALVAAAAAHKLQMAGQPARSLTLVYPPADISSAINDNLLSLSPSVRHLVSPALNLLYFRLRLTRHLPYLGETETLFIIPKNSYDLATYASEPASELVPQDRRTVEYLDVGYSGYYTDEISSRVHDLIGRWLLEQGAITSF